MCRKKLVWCFIFFLAIVFFIYSGFGLVKSKDRCVSLGLLSKEVKERIQSECHEIDPERCALYGMKLTCELLRFTEKNDIRKGKANCVGYAKYCSEICNYAMKKNRIPNRTRPVVGYVSFYGIDLCEILETLAPKEYKNFVKDHDFVELDLGDKYKYFDASLYDYYLDCTTYHEKE